MIHRHIARFNVVDTDFPVQVTSGAVSRASLNADQVTRLQLLTCGHIDLRQMPKVHIHNKNISAYDIAEVSFEVDSTNYVTDEAHLPADSKVVGNTWLNVNSDGSPDRRYKHNMPCLICEFGKLRISSDTGLDVLFLLSNLLAFDILFWTGCREGEMLALLPKDLTDDDQLRIYKTYHRKKGQDIFGPTKNSKKGGNRNVPIPHWLAEEFRTYCSRLYGLTPDDRVFYMTCTALNKELTRCTQLTYLPDIRVHDLRHSHVSLCIELGYSIVLVAKRIGDTVPVVMRTYAHLYPNKQQELVSKLEAIGSPTSNNDDSDLMSLG